jgi:branched-chain amino acid transport system permease protein
MTAVVDPPIGAAPPPVPPTHEDETSRNEVDPSSWAWLRELTWFIAALLILVGLRGELPSIGTSLVASTPTIGVMAFGFVVGGLNALMAVALILIYRTNRIINFAQAEIGVFGALVFQRLADINGWPYFIALPVGVASAAALGGLVEYGIVRRFHKSSRLILTVATIGLAQVISFMTLQISSVNLWGLRPFGDSASFVLTLTETPFSDATREIGGFAFKGDALVALVALPIVVIALNMFFRTRFGVASRAAAENSDRAGLLGVPVKQVSTVIWIVAGALVGLAISLRVPVIGMSIAASGWGFMLRALAAAVIAKMESLRVAVMAALFLGVIEQTIFAAYAGSTITDFVLLAVIVVALLVQKPISRRAETEESTWSVVEEVKAIPAELRNLWAIKATRWVIGGLVVASFIALPFVMRPDREYQAQTVIVYAMVAVSLVVLTGWSGQVSLGQFAITGFGAAVCSKLLIDHNWDFILAMLAGAAAGAVVSMVLGLVALRVKGFFFAATTLGFAVAAQSYFFDRRYFSWLVLDEFSRVERPLVFERFDMTNEATYYWFCLAVFGIVIVGVRSLRASRIGRMIIAVRDNEKSAQSFGISQAKAKLLTFAISGLIAGLAGALYTVQSQVDPGSSANAYNPQASMQVFSMVVIGGLGSLPGAVLGALYVRLAILNLSSLYALLVTGAGLLFVLLVLPGGLGRVIFSLRDAFLRWYADRKHILVPSLLADRLEQEKQTAAVERDVEEAMERIKNERAERAEMEAEVMQGVDV